MTEKAQSPSPEKNDSSAEAMRRFKEAAARALAPARVRWLENAADCGGSGWSGSVTLPLPRHDIDPYLFFEKLVKSELVFKQRHLIQQHDGVFYLHIHRVKTNVPAHGGICVIDNSETLVRCEFPRDRIVREEHACVLRHETIVSHELYWAWVGDGEPGR